MLLCNFFDALGNFFETKKVGQIVYRKMKVTGFIKKSYLRYGINDAG